MKEDERIRRMAGKSEMISKIPLPTIDGRERRT